jgi:hypothetical protein
MRSILPVLRTALAEHYRHDVTDIHRLWSGSSGVRARAATPDGDLFVKTYRLRADFDYERLNIDTVQRWTTAGIPGPIPVPTGNGEWIHRQRGLAMSVWEWVPASPAEYLTMATAGALGPALARLHRFLDQLDLTALPVNHEHLRTAAPRQITDRFQQLLHLLNTSRLTAYDEIDRVRRRLDQLRLLAQLRAGLPPARLARVHGNLAGHHLLFADNQLAAIINPRVQLADRARELGQIAFDPHTVATQSNWLQIGLACVATYLDANGPTPADEIVGCARLALLHHLTSTHPLEDSLTRQEPPRVRTRQARYWADRCTTISRLLQALPEIENKLATVAGQHDRQPATAGRRP